jgi:hypothetical protein
MRRLHVFLRKAHFLSLARQPAHFADGERVVPGEIERVRSIMVQGEGEGVRDVLIPIDSKFDFRDTFFHSTFDPSLSFHNMSYQEKLKRHQI